MTVQDIRTILRLTHKQGLSVREIEARLKLSKTTVATYLGIDPDANLQVKEISQQQVADGLGAYDRNLPSRMQQISVNPRRR